MKYKPDQKKLSKPPLTKEGYTRGTKGRVIKRTK